MTNDILRHAFAVRLTLRSPFLFRSIDASLHGFDEAQMKDHTGAPVLPADQIKGVIRDGISRMRELYPDNPDLKALETIFGDKSAAATDTDQGDVPNRGRIILSDLVGQSSALEPAQDPAYRVAIDTDTGAARTGALQVIEQVVAPHQDVTFEGRLTFFGTAGDAASLKKVVPSALRMIGAIGAMKSAGFGAIVVSEAKGAVSPDLRLTESSPCALPQAVSLPESGYLGYGVTFDRPVLCNAVRVADNAFVGDNVLPGSVFKAALAQILLRAGIDPEKSDLGQVLSKIRISHAYPTPREEGTRTDDLVYLPSSLISAEVGQEGAIRLKIRDALHLQASATGSQAPLIDGKAPLYPLDWKWQAFDEAARVTGLRTAADVPVSARTRTAVKNDQADAHLLFTSLARTDRWPRGAKVQWTLAVDLGGLGETERPLAGQLVALLQQGLDGIGKTDARATFTRLDDVRPPVSAPFNGEAGTYALVLRSPALMLDLHGLQTEDGDWRMSPFEAYQAYFGRILAGAKLENFFASQKLAGGYLGHRHRIYGSRGYYPFLLTQPGSVFRLSGVDANALDALLRKGLPLPEFEGVAPDQITWKTCPFVPENGYGDFIANYLASPAKARDLREGVTHV